MEKKIYTDELERLLKEKSEEFRMYPSKRVWHSIYNDLHPGRKWPSIAMSMVLVIALLLIGSLNSNDNSVKNPAGRLANNQNVAVKTNDIPAQRLLQNDSKNRPQNDLASNGPSTTENSGDHTTRPGNDNNTTIGAISGNEGTAFANGSTSPDHLNDKNASQNSSGINSQVEAMDKYIKSNQLFSDIYGLNKRSDNKNTNAISSSPGINEGNITSLNPATLQNTIATNSVPGSVKRTDENKVVAANENVVAKTNTEAANKNTDPNEQKAWMEDYALHNKSQRNKWKGRVAMELYATPSVGYRNLSSNIKSQAGSQSYASTSSPNRTVSQKPGLNLEAGFDMAYSVAKNLKVKGGVQLNYTNYGINADQTNHPIGTTLLLNDPNTGLPYLTARTSTLSNSSGLQPVTVHNTTYQISVPVGFAIKLAGNKKVEWHAGASIQPSFVIGGLTNFISTDYSSYVSDGTLLRRWNMNTGIETYLNYKMNGFNLQVGPQFRYQLFSTYSKAYTVNENLYNVGIKVGLVKNF